MEDESTIKLNLVWLALAIVAAASVAQGFISFEYIATFALFMIAGFLDQLLQNQ